MDNPAFTSIYINLHSFVSHDGLRLNQTPFRNDFVMNHDNVKAIVSRPQNHHECVHKSSPNCRFMAHIIHNYCHIWFPRGQMSEDLLSEMAQALESTPVSLSHFKQLFQRFRHPCIHFPRFPDFWQGSTSLLPGGKRILWHHCKPRHCR